MTVLTQHQLDQGAEYLAGCAYRGEISGGYSWRKLAEISGEDPSECGAGLALFDALRACGRLVDLPSVPGTFGHSIFKIVDASRDRQRAHMIAGSPLRPANGGSHDIDGLPLFDKVRQPDLFA